MVYFNNIFIYNNSLQEYRNHIKIILKCLYAAGFYLDVTKYEFYITKIPYLGFIISIKRVKIDPAKIKTIIDWPQPKCLKDI